MRLLLDVRNASSRKGLHRKDRLSRLAERICKGEKLHGILELSLLFCDDDFIARLNRRYRGKNESTDVLAFEQEPVDGAARRALGDVVISLETVERRCKGNVRRMRAEVVLLFCHGLLHLLGYDHGTAQERDEMIAKQADYLGVAGDAAWLSDTAGNSASPLRTVRGGGPHSGGR